MSETMPPEGAAPESTPREPSAPVEGAPTGIPPEPGVAAPPETPAAPIPPAPVKPRTDVGFLIIGIVTALALFVASGFAIVLPGFLSVLSMAAPVIGFVAFLLLFLRGKKADNVRLWSWAKGGMWGYLALVLLALLLFGSCFIGGFPK